MKLTRRQAFLGAGSLGLVGWASRTSAALPGLPPATAEEVGLAPDLAARMEVVLRKWQDGNLHSVLVVRNGRLVFERYFSGEDGGYGRVPFNEDALHDMRSISKSVTSLLYGIALAEGKVPPPGAPLLAQFPEYPDLAADPKRQRLLISHALTMTLGLEWNERIPYTDPANGEVAMERAADRYRFILERPVASDPGGHWAYSGGSTQLLGRLITKGTGRPFSHYARETLFDPLGIGSTEWRVGRDLEPRAASGLRLRPRDLAVIGQMILNGGTWDGRRIVPASWLEESFTAQAYVTGGGRYGYQWWLGNEYIGTSAGPKAERSIMAAGLGGQRLFLFPELKLLVVTTAGNYEKSMQSAPPRDVLGTVLGSL